MPHSRIPSGGWKLLDKPDVTGIHLPATVEEYLWGWNGETFGVTGDYVGVSWFETEVDVPASWQGRRVVLDFEGVRFRAEVFVNHKLAGYDLVNSTPFGCDVSGYLNYGGKNVISVQITDPNGNFNWKDSEIYTWGEYNTNPSHGFGGINGKVSLTATSRTYVSDIFVKNTPTPTKVDVAVSTFSPRAIQGQEGRLRTVQEEFHGQRSRRGRGVQLQHILPQGKVVERRGSKPV